MNRRKAIVAGIKKCDFYLRAARYYVDRGGKCPRCKRDLTAEQWRSGDHACLAITRQERSVLCRELEALDTEAAVEQENAEAGELRRVDIDELADWSKHRVASTDGESLERELRARDLETERRVHARGQGGGV